MHAADAIIVGEFALAMMLDEEEGLKWTFDSLQIIVPDDSAVLLEDYFAALGYECQKVGNPLIRTAPRASPQEILDFVINSLTTSEPGYELSKEKRISGISIFACDRKTVAKHLAEAPSTLYASFVSPTAIFCAYPEQTFERQAIAMNRFPSSVTLYWHTLFNYRMHFTNEFWANPCGTRCPSLFRRLSSSFAVIPFQEPVGNLMSVLDADRWWKIRADCYNSNCAHFGFYLA
jgi:hypothetical protein